MNQENHSRKAYFIITVICVLIITLAGSILLKLENKNTSVIMKAENNNRFFSEEQLKTTVMVNINAATKEELMLLSGIGEKKAEAIIEYRTKKPFSKIEDILNVEGIGQTIFEKIKNSISIS